MLVCSFDTSAQTVIFGKDKDEKKEKKSPVVHHPRFAEGMLMVDAAGSNIDINSSFIKVNNQETFPLNIDDSGTFFRVGRDRTSSPSNLKIADAIPPGKQVTLIIVNADGSRSEPVAFSR